MCAKPGILTAAILTAAFFCCNCLAGNYTNFDVAIYIPVGVVRSFEDPQKLQDDWDRISSQLKVDKVYIEVQRDRQLAGDELLERVKKFFLEKGVRVGGGMALSMTAAPVNSIHSVTRIPTTASSSKALLNWRRGISMKSFRTISFL
jgi:hypothetical protein